MLMRTIAKGFTPMGSILPMTDAFCSFVKRNLEFIELNMSLKSSYSVKE